MGDRTDVFSYRRKQMVRDLDTDFKRTLNVEDFNKQKKQDSIDWLFLSVFHFSDNYEIIPTLIILILIIFLWYNFSSCVILFFLHLFVSLHFEIPVIWFISFNS